MTKLSMIIPSRNERFLPQTIVDIFAKASSEIEVIVVLDGYWPEPPLPDYPNLILIHRTEPRGMRAAINSAAEIARGEYLLKCDAHCMFGESFDEILKADCDADWVVVPRRKRLDAESWTIQDVGKPDVDYEYLSYPDNPADFGGPGLNGRIWTQRIQERKDILIDENLSFQGSAWFMPREYFYRLELMDETNYGTFWNEAQELGFKSWLSGGKVMVNKKAWYAHLHKGKTYGRGYNLDSAEVVKGASYTRRWMINDAWNKATLPFEWLIDRFWPIPTWPEDWRDECARLHSQQISA